MEPASVVSLVGGCLTLVTRTVKDINDLAAKFRGMDQRISLITARLNTVKATMSHIETWLRGDGAASVQEVEGDLRDSIAACSIVITEIQLFITNAKKGWLKGKIKYLWNEAQFLQFSTALDSQITSMGVFVSVILLNSNAQRRVVLESTASRQALREACDQASLYTNQRRSLSLRSGGSSTQSRSADAPNTERSLFSFDDELIDSEAYRAAFRRVMNIGTRNNNDVTTTDRADVEQVAELEPVSSTTASTVSNRRSSSIFTRATGSTSTSISTSSSRSSSGRPPRSDWKKLSRYSSWSSWSRTLVKEICLAAASGNTAAIERLCNKGGEVNGRYEIPSGPEMQAEGERGTVFKSILQRGSDRTPLHYAAENGHADAIRMLIARGADINTVAKGGKTPLHVAGGDEEVVEALIALGSDITARDDTGATPLHTLAMAGQTAGIRALLATRCPAHSIDKVQRTPLHFACRLPNNADTVSTLLSAGAYANAPDAEGIRPLHEACHYGNVELIQLLVSAGADLEAPAKDLWRPLHYAAAYNLSSSTALSPITALLSLSVTLTVTTSHGEHPLHLAAAAANLPGVSALLSAGVPVDVETIEGKRPLHMALPPQNVADHSTTPIVRLLLDRGADPKVTVGSSKNAEPLLVSVCRVLMFSGGPATAPIMLPLIEVLLEFGAAGEHGEIAGLALLAACEGRLSSSNSSSGSHSTRGSGTVSGSGRAQGGVLLDVVRLLVGPRGGARPTHKVFRALWRNGRVDIWEKRAVHAVLNEVAEPSLRRDEAEWLIVAL